MLRSIDRADIVGAAAGVATAVLIFLSVASVDPQRGVTDQELQTWWADGGNRDAFIFSMYALLVACPCLLLFVSRLRTRLRANDGGGWADTVFACGIVMTVGLGICAVTRGVVARSVRFEHEPLPGVDTLRFATYLSSAAWDLVILFAAVMVGAASIHILATRVLPRWLSWLGVAVAAGGAVLLAVQAAPIALPLLNIWLIASSVAFLRAPANAQVAEPARQRHPESSIARA